MAQHPTVSPLFPPLAPLALFLGVAPLFPVEMLARRIVRRVAARHPELFERLGAHDRAAFAVEPTDLPIVFLLRPCRGYPHIEVLRKPAPVGADARIRGGFWDLVELVSGRCDGDALFFSRRLTAEGDIEAVVALRNALDGAGLDLVDEAAAVAGPAGHFVRRLLAPAGAAAAATGGRP